MSSLVHRRTSSIHAVLLLPGKRFPAISPSIVARTTLSLLLFQWQYLESFIKTFSQFHAMMCETWELETARVHMMPPPLHVRNESPALLTQRAVYVLWNMWSRSLRGSTGFTSIRIFCRILLPCRWYTFAHNVISSSSVGGSDYLP